VSWKFVTIKKILLIKNILVTKNLLLIKNILLITSILSSSSPCFSGKSLYTITVININIIIFEISPSSRASSHRHHRAFQANPSTPSPS
jgi:hypothetical protein